MTTTPTKRNRNTLPRGDQRIDLSEANGVTLLLHNHYVHGVRPSASEARMMKDLPRVQKKRDEKCRKNKEEEGEGKRQCFRHFAIGQSDENPYRSKFVKPCER